MRLAKKLGANPLKRKQKVREKKVLPKIHLVTVFAGKNFIVGEGKLFQSMLGKYKTIWKTTIAVEKNITSLDVFSHLKIHADLAFTAEVDRLVFEYRKRAGEEIFKKARGQAIERAKKIAFNNLDKYYGFY